MRQCQRDELRGPERLCGGPLVWGVGIRRLPGLAARGAGRTRNDAGINSAQDAMPIISIAMRQS